MARLDFRGAAATLTIPGGLDDSQTTVTIDGDTSGWPTGASGRAFVAIIDRGIAGKVEKVLCSDLTGVTLTVSRGYDGTAGVAHDPGATCEHGLGASVIDDLSGHVYDATRDDHEQYLKTDGSRQFTGLGDVAGVPISIGTTNDEGSALTLARSDHTHRIPANSVTPAMLTDASYASSWGNYTPGIVQSSAVSTTVTSGRFLLVGHTMKVQGDVSAAGAGTAGAGIQVSLPDVDDAALFNPVVNSFGHSVYGVASVTAGGVEYECIAVYSSTSLGTPYMTFKRCDLAGGGLVGEDPSVAIGIGGRVRFAVEYEVS